MSVKVSVIVAVKDEETNLNNALESIKNQTLKDIEVLVVDASSKDNSKNIAKSFLTDKRFKFFETDSTVSVARNIGIEKACGKYLAFGNANVIFSKNLIEGMYDCAEREGAELAVAPMSSADIYGKHEFKTTDILSRRKLTNKFDTALIWTPSVANKLFLRSKVMDMNLRFNAFGKAREAAFTLPFAFESDVIACSSRGAACYMISAESAGVSEFPIDHYLKAYRLIIEKAQCAFQNAVESSTTAFDKDEIKKRCICYIDQVYLKEITVLLYSYYRHFWTLPDGKIKEYTEVINSLILNLSESGKKALLLMNRDIFYDGKLIDNKAEMAARPKITVCIGKSERKGHLHKERLLIQTNSIFEQTMPGFCLFVDERLRDIFPEKWINSPNVKFINASSLGEFKDTALEACQTKYIMFQDGFARLNPKILMRHYNALAGREKYGFTTSPITRFDGKKTSEYSFSDLAFYSDMERTRVTEGNSMFALDLFFCNKLFRKEHLDGIHFSFSDNPVHDMYDLYRHCRFKKLAHRGSYLPYTEEEALQFLRCEEKKLPRNCEKIYKKYKSIYHSAVTVRRRKVKIVLFFKKVKRLLASFISTFFVSIFKKMKLKTRIFFYTVRSDGKLLENLRFVYDACDCKKIVFAKMLPHTYKDSLRVKFYMLTSKVIVIDDYMKYLREIRLRPKQKVVQVWHCAGAFKRFGLDAPSLLSRINEYKTHSQYTDVCVSSEYVRQFYAHAFGIDIESVKALGTPRTDALINCNRLNKDREELISRHPLLKNKKVYVYFSTYRECEGCITDYEPNIDWAKLNDDLADDEIFIVSRHPVVKKEFFKNISYSRVKDYSFEPLPSLLSVADVLITDYSSVVFDACLLNTPMVFYCPDFDVYERDFYLDYEKDLPGDIVTINEELLPGIRKAYEQKGISEKMKEFRQKEVGACNGHSTENVQNLIMGYINEK